MTATATDALPRYQMVVDGQAADAASGRTYATLDPYRGQPWATVPDGDAADVDLAVAAARRALSGPWGQSSGFARAKLLRRLGDLIARDADALATVETRGPLAHQAQYERVLGFLASAAGDGATVAAGGSAEEPLGGFFVRPTVLTGVTPSMAVACEEIFGPVLSVLPFDTEEEAVALANDSRYGLAGGVWTKDVHRAHRVAHRLRAGTVWINAYRVVAPNVPFGGYGMSGIGRENGIEAVGEYTETKAVWVELTGGTRDPFTLG